MNSDLMLLIQLAISCIPFILFILLNSKANTKKEVRYRQYLMPPFAVVYSVVLLIFLSKISNFLSNIFLKLADLLDKIHLTFIGDFIRDIYTSWGVYLTIILFNTAAMLAFIFVKRILTAIFAKMKIKPESFVGSVIKIFYTYDEQDEAWYIKEHFGQARTFIKTIYYGCSIISAIALLVSFALCMEHAISAPFYPVFAIIIAGEIAFFIDGIEKEEKKASLSVQADKSAHVVMYPLLRKPLKALFDDKLSAEGTTVNNTGISGGGVEDILVNLEKTGSHIGKNYANFIRKKMLDGLRPNVDYVRSGYDLATGKSLLFNTPFYDKLNPYVFYAITRALLTGGKVMIVLGRHGTEEDLYNWCQSGMKQVSNVPDLWKVSVLNDKPIEEDELPDIGIISRSSVHDLNLHRNNLPFLKNVSFVLVVEPSRLVTTAQIGLNLLIKNCGQDRDITFCSMDRNCDGLVDALSHILMTNITEVSATEYPHGISSFMYWTADSDYLQHRILPGVSRFLGMGTELSMVALKNQVKETIWYGGEAFPVRDAHWIAKQYYYDLLDYAQIPTTQETFDNSFKTSFNMCNEKVKDYSYITVEDDRNNLFETRRNFATMSEKQGFVNVISSEYMLREYMSTNTDLFTADAKAIPYITADYARTKRNSILTICLLLSIGEVREETLCRQMTLLNLDTKDLSASLWREICVIFCGQGNSERDPNGNIIIEVADNDGKIFKFKKDETIIYRRSYMVDSGKFESVYTIESESFAHIILDDLQNASYVAEQDDRDVYIGSELKGHIYQKYVPGQFFTLNGKYYEMVSATSDDRILVRRASDHINGRLSYRQVRNYTIHNLEDSQTMGALKTVNDIDIHYQYADFSVDTPGYWKLNAYNDFDNGDLVMVNGVPTRKYHHKQILKFDFSKFGDAFTDSIRITLTNLLNEVFVTLFADNKPFISAITPGSFEAPITYNLAFDNEIENADKCIFVVEDSQLDIGLLITVERNIKRILQIISDYLSWNAEEIEESLRKENEPEEEKEKSAFDAYEEKPEPKKKGFFGRIGDWFKGLFKKKKKPDTMDAPEQDYMMIYGKPHKLVNGKWKRCSQKEFDEKMKARHQIIDEIKQSEKEAKEAEKEAQKQAKAEAEAQAQEGETIAEETPVTEEEKPAKEGLFKRLRNSLFKNKRDKKAEETPADSAEAPVEESENTESEESSEDVVETTETVEETAEAADSVTEQAEEEEAAAEEEIEEEETAEPEDAAEESTLGEQGGEGEVSADE